MQYRWAGSRLPVLPTCFTLLALGAGLPGASQAQTPPDVGSVLREQPKPPPATTPAVRPPTAAATPSTPADAGPRVRVQGVRVTGAKLLPTVELQALLQPLVGAERSFGQLQAAALALVAAYAERGYLAQAFLPPQGLKDGIVEYRVVEGVRGRVAVQASGERLAPARVAAYVEHALPGGATLDLRKLGAAMNLINEQPGVSARVALAPGEGEGAVDLNISATGGPLLRGNANLNNSGSRGTGEWQAATTLALDNPSGRFDSATLVLSATQGSQFARGDYSLAVGAAGLRIGANLSALHYRLVDERFAALDGRGQAGTWGVSAEQPLARRDDFNLTLNASLEQRRLRDRTVAGEVSRRVVDAAQLGLGGQWLTPRLGALGFGLAWTLGRADQRNADAAAADAAGRQTQGRYSKQAWNAWWQAPLSARWSFSAALRGQTAQDNLDSSERFALGGPNGVRAYPVSEAQGDAGWLLGLELRGQVSERWSVLAGLDAGGITVNHEAPASAAATTTPNHYRLAGAGLGVNWRLAEQASLRAVLAAPIGKNPGRDASGNDSDGRRRGARLWASLQVQF